eukprot:TRINITY_DN13316_c0_g1_i1.p1 TRINITY_DN13316_c0_g1~~TRINITY_DN13316_c0_g1_i1.p1  ORF type:complete len:141 (+),score=54.16 TRINITY_DN13316_c0_g1_i1:121-543(+)
MIIFFFFFNDTATTEIYTLHIVGSVRCVQETGSSKGDLKINLKVDIPKNLDKNAETLFKKLKSIEENVSFNKNLDLTRKNPNVVKEDDNSINNSSDSEDEYDQDGFLKSSTQKKNQQQKAGKKQVPFLKKLLHFLFNRTS